MILSTTRVAVTILIKLLYIDDDCDHDDDDDDGDDDVDDCYAGRMNKNDNNHDETLPHRSVENPYIASQQVTKSEGICGLCF